MRRLLTWIAQAVVWFILTAIVIMWIVPMIWPPG